MIDEFRARRLLALPLVLSGLLVSGCMSSPTYGTGKSANAQLTSDLTGMFSMKPKEAPVADYKPRPELVKPVKGAGLPLPEPQDNIVTASAAGGVWPESPEQKRARLRAEATANRDDPSFEPGLVDDIAVAKSSGVDPGKRQDEEAKPMSNRESKKHREEFNKRLAESRSIPTKRKYLSEPPLEYRLPAETAAVGDVGEDEAAKARRLKRMSRQKGGWRDMVPWL